MKRLFALFLALALAAAGFAGCGGPAPAAASAAAAVSAAAPGQRASAAAPLPAEFDPAQLVFFDCRAGGGTGDRTAALRLTPEECAGLARTLQTDLWQPVQMAGTAPEGGFLGWPALRSLPDGRGWTLQLVRTAGDGRALAVLSAEHDSAAPAATLYYEVPNSALAGVLALNDKLKAICDAGFAGTGEGALALRQVPPWADGTPAAGGEAPAFLTADQQALYRAAARLYDGFYGAAPGFGPGVGGQLCMPPNGVQQKCCYRRDGGFFYYESFLAALHAAFTDDFCAALLAARGAPLLIEKDGALYAMLADRSAAAGYVGRRWEPVSTADERIVFKLTGIFNDGGDRSGNRDRSKDRECSWEIAMVHTERGWRFDSFASPPWEPAAAQ